MNPDLIQRLERKIDQLLERKAALEEECRLLRTEKSQLLEEREGIGSELDRILAKLDHLDLGAS